MLRDAIKAVYSAYAQSGLTTELIEATLRRSAGTPVVAAVKEVPETSYEQASEEEAPKASKDAAPTKENFDRGALAQRLVPTAKLLARCLALYAALQARRSVLLIGAAGVGKTSSYRLLRHAMTKEEEEPIDEHEGGAKGKRADHRRRSTQVSAARLEPRIQPDRLHHLLV